VRRFFTKVKLLAWKSFVEKEYNKIVSK